MSDPFEESVGRWLARRTRPTGDQLEALRDAIAALPERRTPRLRPVALLAAAVAIGAVALGGGVLLLGGASAPAPVSPGPTSAVASAPVAVDEPCPVTAPDNAGGWMKTSGTLVTELPPDGTITLEPGALLAGRLQASWIWATADTTAKIALTGRRLDAAAPALLVTADRPSSGGPARRWTVVFPTPGCWEVDGSSGASRLSVVVRVPNPQPVAGAADGRSFLDRVVEATIALRSAHVVATLPAAGGLLGGPASGRIEGDVDVAKGQADLLGSSSEEAAKPVDLRFDRGKVTEHVAGTAPTERPARDVLPATLTRDAAAAALRALAGDPTTEPIASLGRCGDRSCVTLQVLVRPALAWRLVPALLGSSVSLPSSEPPDLPTVAVTVVADAETCVPSRIDLSDAFTGVPHLVIELSNTVGGG